MSEIIDDHEGWKILELFGISTKKIVKADMKFRIGDAVRVECEYLLEKPDEKLLTDTKEYILIKQK